MSRARSCVSQVKPSPMARQVTRSGKRASTARSPVSQAPLTNCTMPTRMPWPIAAHHHAESGRRFAFAGAGMDDEKAALFGLGGENLGARRLALRRLLGVARVELVPRIRAMSLIASAQLVEAGSCCGAASTDCARSLRASRAAISASAAGLCSARNCAHLARHSR